MDVISNNSPTLIRDILAEASRMVIKDIQKRAPRDTGVYANSWKILKKSRNKITVGTEQEKLFVLLEFGTSGSTGDPLHFVINGEDVFVTFVSGFAPIPHLRPASERFKREFKRLVERKIRQHWKLFR